jgi:pimeloyl-ACP methyl ester carboxylesterase
VIILKRIFQRAKSKLDIDSFYLAGNSMGGYFGWNYAVRHPDQVKKMVLLDPVCYPQSPPWFISVAKYHVLSFFPKHVLPKFLITMNLKAVYGDTKRIDETLYDLYFDMAMREGNKKAYMDSFRFMAHKSKNEALSEGVGRLRMPVLLMYGDKDKWVPPEHATLWKRDLPHVECIVYDGVGHVPMEEIPLRTAKDADQFFSRALPS